MRYFNNYAYSLISKMKYEINKDKQTTGTRFAKNNVDRSIFFAQEYLFCMKNI